MIYINNQKVSEGFTGLLTLGNVDRLYVGGDGDSYELYGTAFRVEDEAVVIVPSEEYMLPAGSIEQHLCTRILDRIQQVDELHRLMQIRERIQNGEYNYGISERLLELLEYTTTNTVRQLPTILIGGQLSYKYLCKNDADVDTFQKEWEIWSHVEKGRKKYVVAHSADLEAGGVTRAAIFKVSEPPSVVNNNEVKVPPPTRLQPGAPT